MESKKKKNPEKKDTTKTKPTRGRKKKVKPLIPLNICENNIVKFCF